MSSLDPLLKRAPTRAAPALLLLPDVPELRLPLARVHEVCGAARTRFAVWVAAQTTGPVIWIAPEWGRNTLNPCGLNHLIHPSRLIRVTPRRPEDILWCMEEILRAGAIALAVAELPGLPNLTQIRRMHLAAETGAREGIGVSPIGLLLTSSTGGAPGVETRWQLTPNHATRAGQWRLDRLRARTAPQAHWFLEQLDAGSLPRLTNTAALM
ncbi:MAG: hypothetical protein ABJD13_07885 [Paracoccaceae bacterium]